MDIFINPGQNKLDNLKKLSALTRDPAAALATNKKAERWHYDCILNLLAISLTVLHCKQSSCTVVGKNVPGGYGLRITILYVLST